MTQPVIKKGFETEVSELLKLLTHSMYSNREVFLRELISNAADAIDKLKLMALSNPGLQEDQQEPRIEVLVDEKARTVTVSDTGIGMTQEELIQYLGTIANSGTKKFISELSKGEMKQESTHDLIGQFGVGFYSSFVVANKVLVKSRKIGDAANEAWQWQSEGAGSYELISISKDTVGTEVILYLKEDAGKFLEDWSLRTIINRYSDHLAIPVYMAEPNNTETKEGDEAEGHKMAQINQNKAIWKENKSKISDEEYQEFYKYLSHDYENPLTWIHSKVEGKLEYSMLLYIPRNAPFDLWNREQTKGLKLYVQRVFIMDKVDQFLPQYLRFVRGVIDSSDLPLNVSREILQHNQVTELVKQSITKRVLDSLTTMAKKDPEQYKQFWGQFGNVIKEGLAEDINNVDQIKELLQFASTHDKKADQCVNLASYVERMPKEQESIYFVVADTYQAGLFNPHMEYFNDKGYEVLVLHDRIDDWMITRLSKYKEKNFKSITQEEIKQTEQQEEAQKVYEEGLKDIIDRLKTHFGDRVKEVRLTAKLGQAPSCVVAENHEMTLHLRRILKESGQPVPEFKPTLELNPEHPMVECLKETAAEDRFNLVADILLDQAIVAEGGELDEPHRLIQNYNSWITQELKKS